MHKHKLRTQSISVAIIFLLTTTLAFSVRPAMAAPTVPANGDFEQGRNVGWSEFSSHNYINITNIPLLLLHLIAAVG